MPPLLRLLRTRDRHFVKAGLSVLLIGWFAVLPIGAAGQPAHAAQDGRAIAVGNAVLPDSHAALPGLSPTGAGLAEAVREPGGRGGSSGARRPRERAAICAACQPDRPADAARARAAERQRLGHTSTLLRVVAGHASFHCDTPPPAHA